MSRASIAAKQARGGLLGQLAGAEGHLGRARELWTPVDMRRCEVCIEELQRAATALEAAQESAARGATASGARQRLERLRKELDSLSRLVDAASAFSREVALCTATDEPARCEIDG